MSTEIATTNVFTKRHNLIAEEFKNKVSECLALDGSEMDNYTAGTTYNGQYESLRLKHGKTTLEIRVVTEN